MTILSAAEHAGETLFRRAFRAAYCGLTCTVCLLASGTLPAKEEGSEARISSIINPEALHVLKAPQSVPVRRRPKVLATDNLPQRKLPVGASLANLVEEQTQHRPRADQLKACQPLPPLTSIHELTTQIQPAPGELPADCSVYLRRPEDSAGTFFGHRHWAATQFNWAASGLCHGPLYFEQLNLERYGYSFCPPVQPAISAAHFFADLPLLPYKMGLDPPHIPVYDLGFERPGSPAPFRCTRIPISSQAVLNEAAFVTGLVFFIP